MVNNQLFLTLKNENPHICSSSILWKNKKFGTKSIPKQKLITKPINIQFFQSPEKLKKCLAHLDAVDIQKTQGKNVKLLP